MTIRKGGIGKKSGKMRMSNKKKVSSSCATKASLDSIRKVKAEKLYVMQRGSHISATVEKQITPTYYHTTEVLSATQEGKINR